MSGLGGRASGLAVAMMSAALLAACAVPQPIATTVPHAAAGTTGAAPGPLHFPNLRSELTGLHPPEILAMLGQPDLRRDEPPAEVWQYRTADCVVNLFFYQEQDGYRLIHAETWQRSLAIGAEPARCSDDAAPLRAHLIRQSAS